MKRLLFLSLFLSLIFVALTSHAQQPQYIIPVVVHVLHRGGIENISDAQVHDAIKNLNDDFNKRNADTANVVPEFSNNIANMQIEFRLAKIDPNGVCTNGIERIYTNQTYQGQSHFSKLNQWPPDKYLNIWVYASMGGVGSSTIAPFSPNYNAAWDGLAMPHQYIGTIGTGNTFGRHALTHEVGDYLGLIHLEGNDLDCGEDSVADTPLSTFQFTCNLNAVSCDSTGLQNVQNFMTYSYCSSMFTNGQKARVYNNLNTYANRKNLHTQANLIATGTNTNNSSQCAPKADFYTNKPYACVGDSIRFIDGSYNAPVTNRQWQFTDASMGTSLDSVVFVRFNNPGWQTVTLTVSNSIGNSTVSKQLIFISQPQIHSTPYHNGFEDENEVSQNWALVNYDNDAPHFARTTTAALTNSACILLNNKASAVEHNFDELFTPKFDCSELTNDDAKLYFWYSWATSNPNPNISFYDSLVVYASNNCGNTWTMLYRDGTNNVVNAGYVQDAFVPNSIDDWRKITVTIPGPNSNNNFRVSGVSFKIRVYGSSKSNNFYLDDFAIGAEPTVSIKGAGEIASISLMPNPFTDVLILNNIPSGAYTISVSNLQGQVVLQQQATVDVQGTSSLNLAGQPAGVYLVRLHGQTASISLRAIKQ